MNLIDTVSQLFIIGIYHSLLPMICFFLLVFLVALLFPIFSKSFLYRENEM